MFCPVVVGNMFANVGPGSLLVYGCVMCAVGLGVFIVLSVRGRRTPKQKACGANSFWCECYCFPRRPTEECLVSAKWTANTYSSDGPSSLQLRPLAPTHDPQREHQ
ncbi:hypothetical protein NP493_248g03011 [Ridgeia piscesae]|uniref:Transmembrane protein n=1 Tax=Ridgeia piscesae TaxID=27915 RepID=A0AAD9UD78_RIDPI|nr:hypothetical protein NP493_248g03011 [Ridgeia piscesae]